jgi:transcriptional regulator with XRE-family HTH domain
MAFELYLRRDRCISATQFSQISDLPCEKSTILDASERPCNLMTLLAELLGVGRSYLSQIERGMRDPGLRLVKSISDGLRTTMSEILKNL